MTTSFTRTICTLGASATLALSLTACGEKEPETFEAQGTIVDITDYSPREPCTGNLTFYGRIMFEDPSTGNNVGHADLHTLVEGSDRCVYTFEADVPETETGEYLLRAGFYPIAKVSKYDLQSGEDIFFEDDE